jgi:hypothetical protein
MNLTSCDHVVSLVLTALILAALAMPPRRRIKR